MHQIQPPNYTQIPNVIFDYWMNELSHTQFKVLLAICRRTFGWHKERDNISLRQIHEMTGVARASIFTAIKYLEEKGLIEVIRTKTAYGDSATNSYRIKVIEINPGSPTIAPPNDGGVVRQMNQGGGTPIGPTKETLNTKEKEKEVPKGTKKKADAFSRAPNVSTSEEEHEKLEVSLGKEKRDRCYALLSEWKEITPKSKWKKNDYKSILRWVVHAYEEKMMKKNTKTLPKGNDYDQFNAF